MRSAILLVLAAAVVVAVAVLGCGAGDEGTGAVGSVIDRSLLSREQQIYAEAAKPFMEAVVQKRYEAAYQQLSMDARDQISRDAFAEMVQRSEHEFGTPVSLVSVYGVYTKEELPVPAHDDSGVDPLVVADALGPTPDSIPADLRCASVKGRIKLAKDEDGDERDCILTVLLVKERGASKVGWFWFRDHNIWD